MRYGIHRLVYFEQFSDVENAIRREKRLKKWNRSWKIRLIEELNPFAQEVSAMMDAPAMKAYESAAFNTKRMRRDYTKPQA